MRASDRIMSLSFPNWRYAGYRELNRRGPAIANWTAAGQWALIAGRRPACPRVMTAGFGRPTPNALPFVVVPRPSIRLFLTYLCSPRRKRTEANAG